MTTDRFVLLGLAQPRSAWFRDVGVWANAGSIPAEFVKCVSAEEVRARLASGRRFSALLVDASLPALDRDLIDAALRRGAAVLVVGDRPDGRDWLSLGARAALPSLLERSRLVDALRAHAAPVGAAADLPTDPPAGGPSGWRGRVATVCGPGGTGASTVAIALAQGVAADPRLGGSVVLADLALHAEQAMLHDAGDIVPALPELVDAHRAGRPSPSAVRSLTFRVPARGYDLLLGLRHARDWTALRPRALGAALDGLQGAYRAVVFDTDADLEGEEGGGSLDVEERHALARHAAARADVVFAVGAAGLKGTHSLLRVVAELAHFGVAPARIVPVVNRAPRNPRARAEVAATVARLAATPTPTGPTLFLPERRVDDALRDGGRLPAALAAPLAGAFRAVVEHSPGEPRVPAPGEPVRVAPGTLGAWSGAGRGNGGEAL